MTTDAARKILEAVRDGSLDVDQAVERLRRMPFEDLGFAKLDHHRGLRTGMPEVVYCPGKTNDQIRDIVARLYDQGDSPVLATRAGPEVFEAVRESVEDSRYFEAARIVVAGPDRVEPKPNFDSAYVGVVSAGTADVPVADEAAVTLTHLGDRVERLYDVGVAGLHRLLGSLDILLEARCLVVVAGMEGALPSVVAGLVPCPVIAVPTSVGYGAAFGGLASLLGMLNTCSSGVAVVNIDNGFGAAVFASMVNGRGDV
ncbi:MAG: nickel pincer cofactor biosynthesis protein LarB [Armatimonadia bacterium]|jgi:hypothetical protein|nr:nickel pincer cofactor biosynthesis protein LarB [Armatimonadia bacterium]